MTRLRKMTALTVTAALAFCADLAPDAASGFRFMAEANAVVGAPLTPVSVAGVARRSAYRTVAATSTAAATQSSAQAATAQQQAATAQQQAAVVQQPQVAAPQPAATAPGQALPLGTVVATLPAGCTQTTSGGVQYSKCGANYYRAAFQGNNLVYVTAQP
jgi:hypothetical protein